MTRPPAWIWFSLLTVLLWGAWGLASKFIVDATDPWTVQLLFTFGLAASAVIVLASPRRFKGASRSRGLAFASLTGLLGGLGNIAFYMALERGRASIVVPLTSLFPLATVGLAAFALNERVTARQWIGVAVALASIYFLTL